MKMGSSTSDSVASPESPGDLDWSKLEGGYRLPYDPRPAVDKLQVDPNCREAWDELWNELHHQGDVGEASYAAVPLLVGACESAPRDDSFHGLIAVIELERHRETNPDLPACLVEGYSAALRRAKSLALEDLERPLSRECAVQALAVVALASGQLELGTLLVNLESSEIDRVSEEAWVSSCIGN